MWSRIHAKRRTTFRIAEIFFVCCSASYGSYADLLPSNFYNAKTISTVAKRQSFSNENLFLDAVSKGHFSVYVPYPKISVHPSCDFCIAHRYRKINKGQRAVSCEASEGLDSGFTGLLHLSDVSRLQPSLLRFRLMWLRTFQFWKMGFGALAIFRGIFLGPGRTAGWFLRGFWGPGARGGSFGVTKPKRDILVTV
jgi:hypothetical protein